MDRHVPLDKKSDEFGRNRMTHAEYSLHLSWGRERCSAQGEMVLPATGVELRAVGGLGFKKHN